MKRMDVLLLRHGKTAGNEKKRYIGRTDEPLSALGVAEANALCGLPPVSRVFVSPMLRARETASILFPHASQLVYPDLREMDFGDFEGRSAGDMATDAAYRAWVAGGCTARCPGGEDMASFSARTCAAFCEAVSCALAARETHMALVAHGGTLMAVLSAFAQEERPFYMWSAPNCCGWRATIEAETWKTKPAFYALSRFPIGAPQQREKEIKNMKEITLRPLTDADVPTVKTWLYLEHVAAWYHDPEDWLCEIKARHGAFSFLRHFIVEAAGKPIGFCQYYDYKLGGEDWHGDTDIDGVYSIDYLLGDTAYLKKGYGKAIVMALIEKIRAEAGAKRIIVKPELQNDASCGTLRACGFAFDAANGFFDMRL